jgi:hypothetical protein
MQIYATLYDIYARKPRELSHEGERSSLKLCLIVSDWTKINKWLDVEKN